MFHESLLYDLLSPGTDTVNLRGPDNNERIFSGGISSPGLSRVLKGTSLHHRQGIFSTVRSGMVRSIEKMVQEFASHPHHFLRGPGLDDAAPFHDTDPVSKRKRIPE